MPPRQFIYVVPDGSIRALSLRGSGFNLHNSKTIKIYYGSDLLIVIVSKL